MKDQFEFMEEISSEKLAYWYLRLNGFLTITNFIVHPDFGRSQRTDVDILGCRFPYRQELLENSMLDDESIILSNGKTTIVIAEVKRRVCNLNGPWTKPEMKNMQRVLHAVGAFHDQEISAVASGLYEKGTYENKTHLITLLCFGEQKNPEIEKTHPAVPQILWNDVLAFIFKRFKSYMMQKSMHPQWDSDGRYLWDTFVNSLNINNFIGKILHSIK
jgi:hypothetical protein